MCYSVEQAATLIADFDPALASLYKNSPFNRKIIAEVFEKQIAPVIGDALASRIAAVLLIAAEVDLSRYKER
jgi:hypothetical protein